MIKDDYTTSWGRERGKMFRRAKPEVAEVLVTSPALLHLSSVADELRRLEQALVKAFAEWKIAQEDCEADRFSVDFQMSEELRAAYTVWTLNRAARAEMLGEPDDLDHTQVIEGSNGWPMIEAAASGAPPS